MLCGFSPALSETEDPGPTVSVTDASVLLWSIFTCSASVDSLSNGRLKTWLMCARIAALVRYLSDANGSRSAKATPATSLVKHIRLYLFRSPPVEVAPSPGRKSKLKFLPTGQCRSRYGRKVEKENGQPVNEGQ